MKKLAVLNTVLLIGIIIYLLLGSFINEETNNEVFIVTGELHQNFDYQKELNEEFLSTKVSREKEIQDFVGILHSLELKIKGSDYTEQDMYDYQVGINRLQTMQQNLDIEIENINADYNAKIWDKLNIYIKEFAEEKDYKIIFGADGNGNIMYAKDAIDVTSELTDYCNRKYNGK